MSSATPVTLLCCGLLGVTADDGGILERAFTEAFATQGIVPGTAAYARSMVHVHQTRGQSAVDVFRALFPDAPGRAEASTLSFDRSYRLAVDRSGLAPMPGAPEALEQIRGSGVRLCFITGLSRGLVGLVLDTLGWWRQVDLVLCPEDAPRGYPWPDPMLCAMLRLGVTDVRETAYAGGTESGILCGRRAGAQIVAGILTGGHTRDRLQRAGATHLLGSFAELPAVLAGEGAGVTIDPAAGLVEDAAGPAVLGPAGPGAAGHGAGRGRRLMGRWFPGRRARHLRWRRWRRPPDGAASPGTLVPPSRGAIAQLEEHLLCKQGVRGSSPLSSTGQKLNSKS